MSRRSRIPNHPEGRSGRGAHGQPALVLMSMTPVSARALGAALLFALLAATVPARAELVAHFPLDGNGADVSGNAHHGVVHGGAGAAADRFGNPAGALAFDGADDYVDIGQLLFDGSDATVAFSAKSSGAQNLYAVMVSQGHWGTADPAAGLPGPGSTGFAFQYGWPAPNSAGLVWGNNAGGAHSWQALLYPVNLEADLGWHHYAATKSGNTITLYFDGSPLGSTSPGLVFSNYRFNIGRDTYNGDNSHRSFFGAIDEVRVYDHALAPSEIADLMRPPVPPPAGIANLVSWWRAEGDARDTVGSNHGAALAGAGFAPGMFGEAFLFDGTDDAVAVPDHSTLDLTDELTVAAWVRATSCDSPFGWCALVSKAPNGQVIQWHYALLVSSGGALGFGNGDGSGYFLTYAGSGLLDGAWHHVVFSYGGALVTLYIDGGVVQASSNGVVLTPNSDDLEIGRESGEPFFAALGGEVDEVMIYGRALELAEVQALADWKPQTAPALAVSITAGGATTFCDGGSVLLTATPSGGSGTYASYQWFLDGSVIGGATTSSYSATESGEYAVTVTDSDESTSSAAAQAVTVNPLPVVSVLASAPTTFCEGGSVTLSATPAGGDYVWSDGQTGDAIVVSQTGSYRLTATSPAGCSVQTPAVEVMVHAPPVIVAISGPAAPAPVGNTVATAASFTDLDSQGSHDAVWEWGDGAASAGVVSEPPAAGEPGSISASHSYTQPGVYTVRLTVSDDSAVCGAVSASYGYVVVFDANGGFVTGGGSIASPAGAYRPAPTLTGRAAFGFVAKYQKGASVPVGQTQFEFAVGEFRFHSLAYEWLVVAGSKAQFKGNGIVGGSGDYGFLLTATDGQVSGGGGDDRFRIKIWERASGAIVYDNVSSDSDDLSAANPQRLDGGNIVIHVPK